jgi:hypothetical protein
LDLVESNLPTTRYLGVLTIDLQVSPMDCWQGVRSDRLTWEREFFHLAGCVLATKEAALDFHLHGGLLPDGGRYDLIAIFVGELTYAAEMHLVLKEAGMLPAQRLARCAGWLL